MRPLRGLPRPLRARRLRRRSRPARGRCGSSGGGRRTASPASISSVTTSPTATPSATFSVSSAVGETRPRVSRGKAFSSRSSASEPATSRTVTKARVKVAATAIAKTSSGGVEALTTCLSTAIGWVRRSSSGPAVPRLLRARVVKRITRSSESRIGPGGTAGRSSARIAGAVAQAEDFDRLAQHGELSAVEDEAEEFAPFAGDPPRDHQVGLGQQRVDPVVDQARLDRVLLVDDHVDFGRARGRGRERVDPVDQVGGQDQRREHVAGADLVFRFGPVLDVHALDPFADRGR